MDFRRATALCAAVFLGFGAAAGATVKSVKAYARPERVYAGQDFEVCYEILLSEATDMNIYRPSGLPQELYLGSPRIDDRPGAQTSSDEGFLARVVMPARSDVPLEVAPRRSSMDVELVTRVQSLFGTATRMNRGSLAVEWTPFKVLPLPEEGRPENFSGAVGRFTLESTVEPRDLATGDIAKWRLVLRGEGNLHGAVPAMPPLDPPGLFKTYPVTGDGAEGGGLASATANIVPLSTNATVVAGAEFAFFDPYAGKYSVAKAPPVRVTVRERGEAAPETVKTIDLATAATAVETDGAETLQLYLAPSASSLKTFKIRPSDAGEVLEETPDGKWRRVTDRRTGRSGWLATPRD